MKHRVSEQLKEYKDITEKLESSKLILDYQLNSKYREKTVLDELVTQLGKVHKNIPLNS